MSMDNIGGSNGDVYVGGVYATADTVVPGVESDVIILQDSVRDCKQIPDKEQTKIHIFAASPREMLDNGVHSGYNLLQHNYMHLSKPTDLYT